MGCAFAARSTSSTTRGITQVTCRFLTPDLFTMGLAVDRQARMTMTVVTGLAAAILDVIPLAISLPNAPRLSRRASLIDA